MDIELLLHGYCEYFAIGFVKKYGGQICACWDFDADAERLILTHAYVKIAENTYVDANGIFKDAQAYMEENFEELTCFKYVEYKTVDDAKRDFKAHSIPYTDKEIKQAVREFLSTTELKCQGVYHEAVVQFTFLKLDADTFVIQAHKQFAVKKNQMKIMKGAFCR